VKPKNKITLWIVITACLDAGSLLVAVFLKPWLIDAEVNIVLRNAGFLGSILVFIAIHLAFIYYVHRPIFRSKYFNFSICVAILLLGVCHLFGLLANTMALREAGEQQPAPEDMVTDAEKDSVNLTLIISIVIIALCSYFSFIIYNSWDRTEKFEDISTEKEIMQRIRKQKRR